jgi:hypothetical protein
MYTTNTSWTVNLSAISTIALLFQIGCSENSDNESPIEQPGVSGTNAMTESAAGAGNLLTAGVGGAAVTRTGGAGGVDIRTSSSAGKGGAAGTAGKTAAAGGKSAAGSAGRGTAGTSGSGGESGNKDGDSKDPCGANAKTVTGTTEKADYGIINIYASGTNEVVKLTTTMIVPKEPEPRVGTLFLWPGIEPLQTNSTFNPVGLGVLQPVLTWGTSCAPGGVTTYDTWWISGMYVNVNYANREFSGCKGGNVMKVAVGDKLDIEMFLEGTTWTQIVTNRSNGNSVDFDIDLEGQQQPRAMFKIETIDNQTFTLNPTKPVDDVIFTSSTVTFKESEPKACVPGTQGENDWFSPPRVSSDGKTCCYSKIILRAVGIAATSPNTP